MSLMFLNCSVAPVNYIDDSYEASTGTPTFLTPIGKMLPLEVVDIEAEKLE